MAGSEQGVNVADLSLEQLNALKKQFEEEIKVLGGNLQQLRTAQARFGNSKESIRELSTSEGGREILVPLTGSMYVPGKITNVDSVMVDIGTGYLVSKKLEDAGAFVARRIAFLEENSGALEQQILMKKTNLDSIVAVMKQKVELVKKVQAETTGKA